MKAVIGAIRIGSALYCLTVVGGAWAQTTWVDEISNSLAFSTANYPSSNWEPYHQKIRLVREAVSRDDNQGVKRESFSLMVTPIQEYGTAVPAGPVGLGETSY